MATNTALGRSDTGYVQGPLKWAIAFTAALGAMLEVIDTSIVNVALTDIQATLGATVSEVGWVVTGYAIANVVLIPLSAWLGDFFGKKTYFVFSLVGFTLASIGLNVVWFFGKPSDVGGGADSPRALWGGIAGKGSIDFV